MSRTHGRGGQGGISLQAEVVSAGGQLISHFVLLERRTCPRSGQQSQHRDLIRESDEGRISHKILFVKEGPSRIALETWRPPGIREGTGRKRSTRASGAG